MDFFLTKRGALANIGYWTIVVVLAFAAMGVADQTTPSTQPPTLPAVQEKIPPNTLPTAEDTEIEGTAANVETQRRFDNLRNELRHELLGNRADTINWWLAATAIFLAFFGFVVVIGGYIGFRRFREIEVEARGNVAQSKKYAEEARKIVEEINEQKRRAEEAIESILTALERPSLSLRDSASDDAPLFSLVRREPDPHIAQEAEEAVRKVRRNPEASPLARAIADASSLQRAGKIEEAIEKWRSIANVMEGSAPDLAARAWLSVGGCLLYEKRSVEDAVGNIIQESVFAFDQALRLKPDYADAYCHRGVANGKLGHHEAAIVNFDQALRIKPDYAEAYWGRGITKGRLKKYEAAVADFDQVLRLKPNLVSAYSDRGIAKQKLSRVEEARADFKTALDFANKGGDDNLKAQVEQLLKKLDNAD